MIRPFLTLLTASLLSGCVTVVPYTPRDTILDEMPPEQACPLLEATVTRAAEPSVVAAEADRDGEYLRYSYLETVHGPFGIPVDQARRELQVFYVNLDHLDVYDNHYVYVYVYENRLAAKLRFENASDAHSFCDLMMSFRANRVLRGGSHGGHGGGETVTEDLLSPDE